MDATGTDTRETRRRGRLRLTLGVLLVIAATLASTLVVANPASAAAVCGHQVRVRNSIYYKACNAADQGAGKIRVALLFRNDHGEPIDVTFQMAFKVDGSTTGGDWLTVILDERENRFDAVTSCPRGVYLSFALRVKENDDSAGPFSVAPAVKCP